MLSEVETSLIVARAEEARDSSTSLGMTGSRFERFLLHEEEKL